MATIVHTITELKTYGDRSHVATWYPLTNGDTGDALEMPGSADRSVQVFGTFGVGGTLNWEGSNDGVNWATLSSPTGLGLSFNSAKVMGVLEITRYMRPNCIAGDVTTSLSVMVLTRRTSQL